MSYYDGNVDCGKLLCLEPVAKITRLDGHWVIGVGKKLPFEFEAKIYAKRQTLGIHGGRIRSLMIRPSGGLIQAHYRDFWLISPTTKTAKQFVEAFANGVEHPYPW